MLELRTKIMIDIKPGQTWEYRYNESTIVKIKIASITIRHVVGIIVENSNKSDPVFIIGNRSFFVPNINSKEYWKLLEERIGKCCNICDTFYNESKNNLISAYFTCWKCDIKYDIH